MTLLPLFPNHDQRSIGRGARSVRRRPSRSSKLINYGNCGFPREKQEIWNSPLSANCRRAGRRRSANGVAASNFLARGKSDRRAGKTEQAAQCLWAKGRPTRLLDAIGGQGPAATWLRPPERSKQTAESVAIHISLTSTAFVRFVSGGRSPQSTLSAWAGPVIE
jgi:hypothetical protein